MLIYLMPTLGDQSIILVYLMFKTNMLYSSVYLMFITNMLDSSISRLSNSCLDNQHVNTHQSHAYLMPSLGDQSIILAYLMFIINTLHWSMLCLDNQHIILVNLMP